MTFTLAYLSRKPPSSAHWNPFPSVHPSVEWIKKERKITYLQVLLCCWLQWWVEQQESLCRRTRDRRGRERIKKGGWALFQALENIELCTHPTLHGSCLHSLTCVTVRKQRVTLESQWCSCGIQNLPQVDNCLCCPDGCNIGIGSSSLYFLK